MDGLGMRKTQIWVLGMNYRFKCVYAYILYNQEDKWTHQLFLCGFQTLSTSSQSEAIPSKCYSQTQDELTMVCSWLCEHLILSSSSGRIKLHRKRLEKWSWEMKWCLFFEQKTSGQKWIKNVWCGPFKLSLVLSLVCCSHPSWTDFWSINNPLKHSWLSSDPKLK